MSSSGVEPIRGSSTDVDRILALVDSSMGVMSIVARTTVRSAGATRRLASPLLRRVERLPVRTTRPRALSGRLHRRGSPVRQHVVTTGARMVDVAVPFLFEQVLRRVDLTDVVRRHVDLDRVVAEVDIDAVVDRVDVDPVAARLNIDAVLDRVDLDAVAARLNIDAVAARLDIDAVLDRVDLDAVATGLDVDAVAARLDIDAVLDRLDMTAVALRRLDLAVLVSAVLEQVDLVAIAQEVIEAVDLPEIIRESSGALTSDTVRGARLRSAAADQALGRVRDRFLPHRNGTRLPAMPTVPVVPADRTKMPEQSGTQLPTPPDVP